MTVFYYERALEMNSTNNNAKGKLDELKEGGQ
jgi:hypothetical protein